MEKIDVPFTSPFGESACAVWKSEEFVAAAFKNGSILRLSIARQDKKDGLTWDELQRIKNECGFEDKDAIEFYPAQKDVINTANIRHLHIFDQPLPMIWRKA